ncbi:AraC family transcriptional regulator [Lentilactobacillus hilgardii]|uniref:AraC family transcriptional regulator n=1 Tax=Lentilactobacillus hilgardii TaxID=1588 RepID=UPI0021A35091|nr:AraC family transcriptional regulator [Lentilactobacillus hilgardii]MCT3398033.1 AraC family transcriptional regulator [Lentilactobacillus hilgardii]
MQKKLNKAMTALEPAEKQYKMLYKANPYDSFKPVTSWNQFVMQYKQKIKVPVTIPKNPPSDIRSRFYENEFFSSGMINERGSKAGSDGKLIYPPHMNSEIVVFKHLRYLPIMMHTLEFVKISYILQGTCEFFLNGKVYHLGQGDLIIVAPNIEQAFFADKDDDIVVNIIMRRSTFQDAFSPLLMEQNDISEFFLQMLYQKEFSQTVLFHCDRDEDIENLIVNLYQESQTSRHGSRIIMNSYVLLLFGQLIRNHSNDAKMLMGRVNEQSTSNIIQFIRNNRTTVNLKLVAQQFNLSQGYLSRYIKRETGYSFSALLRDLKMREAAKLLVNSELSVEEIVDEVGYSDISNFYRNFKKMYGMTPADYRADK